MLIPSRTRISDTLQIWAALRRRPVSPRQRLLWTLGNLMMFAGLYLLLYVGGIYVQNDYQRLAARGDNDLEVPRTMISASVPEVAPQLAQVAPKSTTIAPSSTSTPAASSLPQLGTISSDMPSAAQVAHVYSVERVVIPSWSPMVSPRP